jgi:hypothetical protein
MSRVLESAHMRRSVVCFGALILALLVPQKDVRQAKGQNAGAQAQYAIAPWEAADLYSRDPTQIWNRLFRLFYVRTAPDGRRYGGDKLDPYLWQQTRYLLEGPSHKDAVKLLDEFLQSHAERLITDPLRRAMMQRDLWAVYDWVLMPGQGHDEARAELLKRLGEVIRRLSLKEDQIRALPDNYQTAIVAKGFPSDADPKHREATFLPDLFSPDGPWVCIGQQQDLPVASVHLEFFRGRSIFLVFLRLPEGRDATLHYLQELRKVPSKWAPQPGFPPDSPARVRYPQPQQFPVGTSVALVRQAMLVSDQGKFVPTHLTESVQLRVYRAIDPDPRRNFINSERFRAQQDVFEFRLDRRKLLGGETSLRAVNASEKDFPTFMTHGIDDFESFTPPQDAPIFRCQACHYDPGVESFISHSRAHVGPLPDRPPDLLESTSGQEAARDAKWRPSHPELNEELVTRRRP